MRRLEKSESRRRWAELRDLVNAWDPIGAIALGSSHDEYDDLVGPILRRLEGGAKDNEIASYLEGDASSRYGITFTNTGSFARQVCEWYDNKWIDTTA